jgi:uncharacterized protein (TIGR02284 family)
MNNVNMDNNEAVSTLNGLIETCKDGQEGFDTAAQSVKDSNLVSTFSEYSNQRAEFAEELKTLVSALGGDPENSGTIGGALHRGWLNIKAVVTGGDEAAILNECERGEDSAKAAYQSALENPLPPNVEEIVRKQYQGILSAHQKIKSLRDGAANKTNTAAAS